METEHKSNIIGQHQEGSEAQNTSTENEYELRRRRIAKVFMDAYGKDIADIKKYGKMDSKQLEEEAAKQQEAESTSPYNMQTVFWILATFVIFYYTDFVPAMFYDANVKRTWLYVGAGFIVINVAIAFYLIVLCSWLWKISDWETHSPVAIPIATCFFVCGSICVNIAVWPVYGLLTPVMLFTIFMGFVVVVSLLPSGL